MTAEKRYAAALYMLQAWEQAAFNRDDLTRAVEKEPQKWQYAKAFPVAAAAAEIMIDALESMDSKRSSKRSLTAAKNIIANCPRQDLQGVFEDGGKYCICDGYRAIRYNADMESLPRAAGRLDLDKIMRDAERAELLELPTAAAVRAWIAAHGGKKGAAEQPYIIAGLVAVNARYLLDMLQGLDNCRMYVPANDHSAIYCEGDNGDGVLLPVRVASHKPEAAEIAAAWEARRRSANVA